MTYKQIETSREIRQWIGLTVAAITAAIAVDRSNPELRPAIKNFAQKQKTKLTKLFKKGN